MATKIIPKKSVLSGAVPPTGSLGLGEIAINHADKKIYAKHPATGTIQEIGAYEHSHDELYSIDGTQHLELQNNGDLTLPNGGTISDSSAAEGSITLTPPNATAGQGLVIRPTVGVSLTNDIGFSAGATITVTLTDAGSHISEDWTANGGKDANWAYTITGITTGNLGSALTGTFAAGDWFISGGNYINTKVFNIPAGSTGTGFNIRLNDAITSAYSGYPTPPNLELTVGATSTSPETGHLHLVTADPANVDLYLGDDYQFVKLERNSGGIVVGNNNNTHQWNFKTDGTLALPSGGDITLGGTSVLGAGTQANWTSTSGTSEILNKPTLGTAAATDATDYATAAQGTTADSALQASALTPYRTSAAQDTIDAGKVGSVTTGIAPATPITNMMQITLSGYNAITPAANTLYIIVG